MSLALFTGNVAHVYKEHAVWDDPRARSWNIPATLRAELYVCSYKLPTDKDGDVIAPQQVLHRIQEMHPNCVVVG